MTKAKIAVLVSGGGTNLQALIDAERAGKIKSGEIVLVVSNSAAAYALERAKNAGIESLCLTRKDCGGQEAIEQKLIEALDSRGIDLVILAGFMSILSETFTGHYPRRIINIHPALIPAFCGQGMYGIRPHEAVLAKGVKVSGATVHFVNEHYDEGPIILQKAVDVLPDDTPETLQKRIMKECEQVILPQAIQLIADGRIEVVNNLVRVKP
jgi:phosphoribosylglycinamide formyltransferase-1